MKDNKFKNTPTNKLKEEYIASAFGTMIYGVNTEAKRKELAEEINRRQIEAFYHDLTLYAATKKEIYLTCAKYTLQEIENLGFIDTFDQLQKELEKEFKK